jgi:hypothetical protein
VGFKIFRLGTMKEFAIIVLGLAFILLVGYIVYHFENPWWSLMALALPSILNSIKDNDGDNPDMI